MAGAMTNAALSMEKKEKTYSPQWGRWGIRSLAFIYLGVLLIVPIIVIVQDGFREGLSGLIYQITLPAAWHALKLTFWTSAVMTAINTVMGTLTAYVMVRYTFPGKNLLNAIIDLPLAIPTLVTGVMLVIMFGPQRALGAWLQNSFGISIIFAPPGIILALLFITFPFMVRSIQPVLIEIDRRQEDAAATLGANNWTIFWKVIFPYLTLPIASGALLSFARAIGEFGSIVIVAGNIPLYSQTAAVYVLGQVESENRLGASAVSIIMMAVAFSSIFLVSVIQRWANKRKIK